MSGNKTGDSTEEGRIVALPFLGLLLYYIPSSIKNQTASLLSISG
jgi:hypothetical protein